VPGIGAFRVERYGAAILGVLLGAPAEGADGAEGATT
jgi:hypothetical protein